MKTKVNLYSAEFQPTLRLLSVGILLSSWLLLVVVLLTFWAVKLNQQQTLTDQLNKLNQQNEEQSTLVATLQTGLANRQSDPLLLQEVNKKVSDLAVKNQVMQELQGQEDLKSNGFSALMLLRWCPLGLIALARPPILKVRNLPKPDCFEMQNNNCTLFFPAHLARAH